MHDCVCESRADSQYSQLSPLAKRVLSHAEGIFMCVATAGAGGMQQDVQQARQAFSDAVLDVLMEGPRCAAHLPSCECAH